VRRAEALAAQSGIESASAETVDVWLADYDRIGEAHYWRRTSVFSVVASACNFHAFTSRVTDGAIS